MLSLLIGKCDNGYVLFLSWPFPCSHSPMAADGKESGIDSRFRDAGPTGRSGHKWSFSSQRFPAHDKGDHYHPTVCGHPFERDGQFCGLKWSPLFGSREPGKFICLFWPDPWRPSHLAGRQCVSISDRFLVGLPGPWWLFPHCAGSEHGSCRPLGAMGSLSWLLYPKAPCGFSFQVFSVFISGPLTHPRRANPTFAAKRRETLGTH